jgi:hypothetical protein
VSGVPGAGAFELALTLVSVFAAGSAFTFDSAFGGFVSAFAVTTGFSVLAAFAFGAGAGAGTAAFVDGFGAGCAGDGLAAALTMRGAGLGDVATVLGADALGADAVGAAGFGLSGFGAFAAAAALCGLGGFAPACAANTDVPARISAVATANTRRFMDSLQGAGHSPAGTGGARGIP